MYALKPLKVYLLEGAADDPRCRVRFERVLDAIGYPLADVVEYNAKTLPEVSREYMELWPPTDVPEGVHETWMRPLVFTTLKFTPERPAFEELVAACPEGFGLHQIYRFLGYIDNYRSYHKREDDRDVDMVCWPTWDFGVMEGCPHGCQYCGEGRSGRNITLGLNLEDYVEHVVEPKVLTEDWQKCFRLISWGAEVAAFEPEYGAFEVYLNKLAELDRYGYFHTNTDNTDWAEGLTNPDRLIGIWSISGEGQASLIEPGAPTSAARVTAMARLTELGVPFRPKFKPLVPVKTWREDNAACIKDMFERSKPESVGFCVYMWNSFESMSNQLDLEVMDPKMVAAARDAADEMNGVRVGPFPHEARAEIYRFMAAEVRKYDQDVPIFISTESRAMWDDVGPDLGQDPDNFFCGCSSVALPGRKMSLSKGCPQSTYSYVDVRDAKG
jgi:hypothetical protein